MNNDANQVNFDIKGSFTKSGFLSGGYFEGSYSYTADTPDSNKSLGNVGAFKISDFEINVFDSRSKLVDTLNETNSTARIILSDLSSAIPGADQYKFTTTQDTEANPNAFYEVGSIQLTFDWSAGGSTKSAPAEAPEAFQDGRFSSYGATDSWESFTNPQSIAGAKILPFREPTSPTDVTGLETDSESKLEIGLYDADSNTLIASLDKERQILASEVADKKLTIAASVSEESRYFGQVESIFLNLNDGQITRTENVEPYALFGDRSGDLNGGSILEGDNTISFELYDQNRQGGNLLDTVTVDFTIV
ncbi:MAG: hypothetical protein ACFB4I_17810 [Cyanophyceae cyanobacterium]